MKINALISGAAALFILACLGGLSAQAQTANRSDFTGRVILPPGESGPATVLISMAARKPDAETSAYGLHNHFPRRTQTDSQGGFKFESVDPAWLYRVLIIAPGCRLKSFDRVDPISEPLTAQLEASDPASAPSNTLLRGRVLDSRGQPISGAVVRVHGVTRDGSMRWPADNIDSHAVSDNAGNFLVYGRTPFTAAEGAVEAVSFATGLFERWEPGETVHTVTLNGGAAFTGRLLKAGNPVARTEVRLDNFGSESGSSAWNYSTLTDDQGRFLFANLPTNRRFNMYATMESLGDRGALSKQAGEVHGVGSTNDIGDVSLQPAFKVEGRISLTDEKPIPAHSRLSLLRTSLVNRQDGRSLDVGPDGAFSFTGVPAEKVTIYFRVPGYEISPKDRILKFGSATNLMVSDNINGLVIPMQPQARW